eukprot:3255448-Alexandrium_andersonii.AAC.1
MGGCRRPGPSPAVRCAVPLCVRFLSGVWGVCGCPALEAKLTRVGHALQVDGCECGLCTRSLP